MRLVRTPKGVQPDASGKLDGRGAYVHANQDCLGRAMKGPLNGALQMVLSAADREGLEAYMRDLPAEKARASNSEGAG